MELEIVDRWSARIPPPPPSTPGTQKIRTVCVTLIFHLLAWKWYTTHRTLMGCICATYKYNPWNIQQTTERTQHTGRMHDGADGIGLLPDTKNRRLRMHRGRFPATTALGATARSYHSQDGADAAARFEKFLPARASLRPPISLKFTTEKYRGMVHLAPKRQTRTFSRFCTIIPERLAARRR